MISRTQAAGMSVQGYTYLDISYMIRSKVRDPANPEMPVIYERWFFGVPVTLQQNNQHFMMMFG